jgi:hypothetical protein
MPGHWLTGLPTAVSLKPHTQQRVTIRIVPPPGLADGEYYARIVTLVRPPTVQTKAVPKDTKTIYKLPVIGEMPPRLQEAARVFYHHGTVRMGIAVGTVTTGINALPTDRSPELADDWIHIPFHLTGNAHFEGVVRQVECVPSGDVSRWSAASSV